MTPNVLRNLFGVVAAVGLLTAAPAVHAAEYGLLGLYKVDDAALFETALGKLAVLICYDSEFPLLARAAVDAGAEVLLVPSCTDSLHGYWRVRLGAQARAKSAA